MAEAAGLTVGGWVASALISKVIDKVKSHLEDNYDSYAGMDNRLKDLAVALARIEEAIEAAEARLIKDKGLVVWLRGLKDAAYQADDMFDDLESKSPSDQVKSENKVRGSKSSKLKALKYTVLTDDYGKNLKSLMECLDKICGDINHRLPELHKYIEKSSATRENRCFLKPHEVIGRDKEANYIISFLLNYKEEAATGSSNPSFVVLPIVGIGGVGKTTLAWYIFNHERLSLRDKSQKNHFPLSAWLNVSNNLDVKHIASKLVSIFSKNKSLSSEIEDDYRYDDSSLEYMLNKLENMTRNQRFLIILDDVWYVKQDDWKALNRVLKCGARGSSVLVTTQYQRVAEIMRTVHPIQLDLLNENDYQRLLEQCAFGDQILDEDKRQNLHSIGKEIFKTLQGLPRAGNALGNLLSSNLDPDYWKEILQSKWWLHDAVLYDVLPSLGLNYQSLNARQKLCFAYCSIFPKGYIFVQDRLVHMWMAQGFIQSKPGGMRIEDIGRQVFTELVDRNFFQRRLENEYVMHDVIRELAIYISLDECFVINDETEIEEIPSKVYHLTVKTDKLDAFRDLSRFKNLRTILFFGNYETKEFYETLKSILKCSKSLRVLDLSHSHTEISKLPRAIGDLSHLRYLDISNTKISLLPKLFCKLCHLQVLNLQHCHFSELPEGMNKLINLRHLCADSKTISLISGIGKLTHLQELKEFHVAKKKGHKIEELKNLKQLRGRLLIQNLENVDSKEEAMSAKLMEKRHLGALQLYFEIKDGLGTESSFIPTIMRNRFLKSKNTLNLKGLLEGLEPCCDLKELGIKGYHGDMFPNWLVDKEHLSSLTSIHLCSCHKLTSLPPLGQLPFLRVLHIETMPALRKIGVELYGSADKVFPSLEVLTLRDLQECEEWSEVQGRWLCPRLQKLHIEQCLRLTILALLNLNPPITELKIDSCGDLGNALPQCLQRFTSLTILKISNYQHGASLSLSNLVVLENLCLSNCPGLSFQENLQSLTNLKQLEITECPMLCNS